MLYQPKLFVRFATMTLLMTPAILLAQTTHVVQVNDFNFSPAHITIQAGDTVRWENPPGGASHNVIAENLSFSSGATTSSFTYQHTFNVAGQNPYYCQPHRFDGMTGSVTVQGSIGPTFEINAGLNGNWWSGPSRDGEGAQVEVAATNNGGLVFVVTIYSYAPEGGQIFLVGAGNPDGDTVEVDLVITSGGAWGNNFDPDDTPQTPWGTAMVTASDCDEISMTLTPNAEYQALGYTEITLELERLTTAIVPCPYED